MKIIILGAGQVGTSLANNLSIEANDITVVDVNAELLNQLQDRLDLRTVIGRGSHPEVLIRAGAEDADMVIAVTNSDETNIVACQVAYTLFHTPTKIARIRSQNYLFRPELFGTQAMPIDYIISPEQLVTDYVARLIQYPGAIQVVDFAGGMVRLVAVRAFEGSPLVGHELRALHEHFPNIKGRIAAIYRKGKSIHPGARTVVRADDEIFFIAAVEDISKMMGELRSKDRRTVKRIIIAGGGNIGRRLAKTLEKRYQVKLIDKNPHNTKQLSEELENTIVLLGNAADEELLIEENIDSTHIFCAVTNDDEANILSAMLAKRLGARKVMALINRTAYVDLVESSDIDIAISPQHATIGSLLAHVRRGDVVNVHSLRHGAAEAIEAVAHGDEISSHVVGRKIEEIRLPTGTTIGSIVRGDEVIVPHHDTMIKAEDHLVLFLVDKKAIPKVEALFQVGVTFV